MTASPTGPPRAKLFELDLPTAVHVDRRERGVHLNAAETEAQLVEELGELRFVDLPIGVAIDAVEAVAQRVIAHRPRLRCPQPRSNRAIWLLALALGACRSDPPKPQAPPVEPGASGAVTVAARPASSSAPVEAHPVTTPAPAEHSLPPLRATWLEWLEPGRDAVVVTPPLGAVSPTLMVVGVHGAGDRPDWSCGGWRLASQVSVFITCPQGTRMSTSTFGWSSAAALEAGVARAIELARARFGPYIDDSRLVFAGFSQGATLAEPLLRKQAARFPIAILAEGGYQTARSPAFAAAYRAGGGRRVVLVCGTDGCFRSATGSKKVLEGAGLEVLVAGDPKAGHNLNQEMQRALQAVWPQIVAPLP